MKARTRKIQVALDRLTEDLLSLSDETWQNIEHNDPEALDVGYQLKKDYNQKLETFNQSAQDIRSILQQLE